MPLFYMLSIRKITTLVIYRLPADTHYILRYLRGFYHIILEMCVKGV